MSNSELQLAEAFVEQTDRHVVEAGLSDEDAVRESRRCMSCGCRKAVGCLLRCYAAVRRAALRGAA